MSPYAWTLLCELVERGPMANYELLSAVVLEELRESELSLPAMIDGVLVLVATQRGISEYRVLN